MSIENFDIDLSDILADNTQERSEKEINPDTDHPDNENTDYSNLEFEPVQEITPTAEPQEEIIPISPYNAAENADILVELIDVVNIQSLTPLARWKLRKKLGGKNKVTKMQLLFEKKINAEKLSEDEKRDIETYQAYLKDKTEIENAIPYTREEKENLKQAAIPYLKQHQIKIGGGMAFWTQLSLIQGSRILQVLTA